jgi:hypothetical protein
MGRGRGVRFGRVWCGKGASEAGGGLGDSRKGTDGEHTRWDYGVGGRAGAHAPMNEASTFLQVRTGIVVPESLPTSVTVVHNAGVLRAAGQAIRRKTQERRTAWSSRAFPGCYPANLGGKTARQQDSKQKERSYSSSRTEIADRNRKSTGGMPRPGETQKRRCQRKLVSLLPTWTFWPGVTALWNLWTRVIVHCNGALLLTACWLATYSAQRGSLNGCSGRLGATWRDWERRSLKLGS